MTYATQGQLAERFGERLLIQLTDRGEVATGQIDQDTIDQALADTDAMIDGYLAGRYALPVASTPPQLRDLALIIAIYKLHVFEPDKKIVRDYEDATRQLKEISSGVIKLPLASGEEPTQTDSGTVVVTDRARPFTEDKLKGFI